MHKHWISVEVSFSIGRIRFWQISILSDLVIGSGYEWWLSNWAPRTSAQPRSGGGQEAGETGRHKDGWKEEAKKGNIGENEVDEHLFRKRSSLLRARTEEPFHVPGVEEGEQDGEDEGDEGEEKDNPKTQE